MGTLYVVNFLNSGNKTFIHHGNTLGLCTLNSMIFNSERDAISNILDILYADGAIFGKENNEYKIDTGSNLKDYVMEECKGNVELLNQCYPDKDCGTIFCFELVKITIIDQQINDPYTCRSSILLSLLINRS